MGGLAGGGKGGSAPKAPDFQKIAKQQSAISQQNVNQQTAANRADQTNAFGATSDWTQGPDGQWSQKSSFGGPLGEALGNLTSQVANQGALPTGDQAREQAISSAYGAAMSRLAPMLAQREQGLRARLASQGLDPTSEAAQAEMGNFERGRNDAIQGALSSAIGQGTQAGNAIFQQGVQSQQLPWQQLQQLQGLGQQASYNMAGQAQTPDMLGAAGQQYQADQQAYAQQQQGKNSTLGGLGSLAGMAGGFMLGGPVGAGIGGKLGGMLGGG